MNLIRNKLLPYFILLAFSMIIWLGSFYTTFPPLILVFINLIFISLFFNDQKVTLYTGIFVCLLYAGLWFTPWVNREVPDKKIVYLGTLFLFAICTGFSLVILNLNTKTAQSLKHFFLLYENATEGIIIVDEHGNILMANPTACRFFGYDEKELLKRPIEVLIPDNARKVHPQDRKKYMANPTNREMGKGRDLFGLKKNGSEFPVEISLSSYRDKRRTYVIVFIIDITVRKDNEKQILQNNDVLEKLSSELSELNNELELKVEERTQSLRTVMENLEKSQHELSDALSKERELNEIKSRFVSMASHEFRTPLSTVLSSAILMEKYTTEQDQPKREKHIRKIRESVRHLNDILEDFLSVGKLEENKIQAFPGELNVVELIGSIIEETEVLRKENQQVEFSFEGNEVIRSDKNLMKNICINLLTNAMKFSGDDGRISIRGTNDGGRLKIVFQDNGIGIPKDDLQHLFSSFFRSKNAQNIQGTGMGLHIVKRYINLLKGEIDIQSELNAGTIVSIMIPNSN